MQKQRWQQPLTGSRSDSQGRETPGRYAFMPRWEQPLQGHAWDKSAKADQRSDSGITGRLQRQKRQESWGDQNERAVAANRAWLADRDRQIARATDSSDSRDDADEWDSERWCHPADFDQIPIQVFDAADSQDLSWQECLDAYFSGRQDSARLDGTNVFSDGFSHAYVETEDDDDDDTEAYGDSQFSGRWRRDPISGLKQFWSNAAGCWKTHSAGV